MLDGIIRPFIDPPLNKIASLAKRSPLTGNMVTIVGFLFGICACICATQSLYIYAFILLIINRLCDGLDGAVARARGESSDFGGYLDIMLDFIIYAGFPLSMAFSINTLESYQAVAFTLFTIVTTGVSFLAYAIIAAKKNLETTQQGKKSFFFSNGLMEGTETIIFMIMLCLLPHYFVTICIIFGALCLITAALRIAMAYRTFK
jgi:phosphatidylglycerophosphate synthase